MTGDKDVWRRGDFWEWGPRLEEILSSPGGCDPGVLDYLSFYCPDIHGTSVHGPMSLTGDWVSGGSLIGVQYWCNTRLSLSVSRLRIKDLTYHKFIT